ncbi:MAG: hypothetical protein RR893_06415, partial [Clostridia bacterium]
MQYLPDFTNLLRQETWIFDAAQSRAYRHFPRSLVSGWRLCYTVKEPLTKSRTRWRLHFRHLR